MTGHPYTPDWRNGLRYADAAARCHARCKHSKRPCKAPAMRGKRVCRMHGGKGGAPRGERNGSYIHGRCTIEVRERERQGRMDYRALRVLLDELKGLG
jgi:hypothetical protein